MTHTIITLHPSGERTEEFAKPSLPLLQAAVDGWIETVGFFTKFEGRHCTAYANEEGLLKSLSLNREATRLWKEQYAFATQLVGTVCIVVRGRLK